MGGLSFTTEPQDVVGVKGSPLLLNCTASGPGGAPVNITWLKDGQEVNDARRYVLRNGSLFFTKVVHRRSRGRDRSDVGVYECLARDRNGTIISRKAKLTCASKFSFLEMFRSLAGFDVPFDRQTKQILQNEKSRADCAFQAICVYTDTRMASLVF